MYTGMCAVAVQFGTGATIGIGYACMLPIVAVGLGLLYGLQQVGFYDANRLISAVVGSRANVCMINLVSIGFLMPFLTAPIWGASGSVQFAAHWHASHADLLNNMVPDKEASNPGIVTFKLGVSPVANATKKLHRTTYSYSQYGGATRTDHYFCVAPIAYDDVKAKQTTFWWAVRREEGGRGRPAHMYPAHVPRRRTRNMGATHVYNIRVRRHKYTGVFTGARYTQTRRHADTQTCTRIGMHI